MLWVTSGWSWHLQPGAQGRTSQTPLGGIECGAGTLSQSNVGCFNKTPEPRQLSWSGAGAAQTVESSPGRSPSCVRDPVSRRAPTSGKEGGHSSCTQPGHFLRPLDHLSRLCHPWDQDLTCEIWRDTRWPGHHRPSPLKSLYFNMCSAANSRSACYPIDCSMPGFLSPSLHP